MAMYLPRLPIQVDPLIAEAKRRARRRRLLAVAVGVLAVAALGSFVRWELAGAEASAATAGSGKQCAGPTTYGSQCIEVRGSGRRVTAIQTWFDNTGLFWPNAKWRIDLERYNCNPIDTTKPTCGTASTWHGKSRTGDIPGPGNSARSAHFAQFRSDRYWPTFSLPHTFRSNVWLCTEVAAYARGRWVYNAAGLPTGLRACAAVHG